MSSANRKPYETATTLDQTTLDAASDNLVNQLETIVEISAPDGSVIRGSDRNKYVGEHFYEALTNFPVFGRTIGDWLGAGIVFSEIELEFSNADGRYNRFLPQGANFAGWVGRSVLVKVGLREVAASYRTIFKGEVSSEAGFGRTTKSIKIKARDSLDRLADSIPTLVFSDVSHPDATEELWGKHVPVVYGDWTTNISPGGASVPGLVTNGRDIFVNGEEIQVTIGVSSPAVCVNQNHRLKNGQKIELATSGTLPAGLFPGDFFVRNVTANTFNLSVTAGGALSNATAAGSGNHNVKKSALEPFSNVKCTVSVNDLSVFDTANVFLFRENNFFRIPQALIVNIGSGNRIFEVQQNSPSFQIEAQNWNYKTGDLIFVRCKGKPLSGFEENAAWIARDLLLTFGGLASGDFSSAWATYRSKSSPAESAVSSLKARVWLQEATPLMDYVISLLEQVRLEVFVNKDLAVDLRSLHLDEAFSDALSIRNWDVAKDSFQPALDSRNYFNRVRAAFGYLPNLQTQAFITPYFRNGDAITQAGRTTTKLLQFPNLHLQADVVLQTKEILKLASAYREVISVDLTTRAFLLDVGDFVRVNVTIGSSQFENVPAQVRQISYDSAGPRIKATLWSFQMIPRQGWAPSFPGIVGGQTATITQE
jgi:hypothetical protein